MSPMLQTTLASNDNSRKINQIRNKKFHFFFLIYIILKKFFLELSFIDKKITYK